MLKPANKVKVGIILLAVTILLTTACLAAEPNAAGGVDAFAINKMLGRGVSIGNCFESPNEGNWGVSIHDEYFDLIKKAGFNSVRIPVRWDLHTMDKAPYTIDPNFLNRIDYVINKGLSANLAMMFNTHNYYPLFDDPNGQKGKYLAIWKQLAEHFKDAPQTLIFEPMNEPQGKIKDNEWNALIKDVLAVIRQSNPNRIILLGPANFNDVYKLKNLQLPKDDRNIIVSFHYYSPIKFTHQGAPWTQGSDKWVGMKWDGSDQEKRLIEKDFDIAAKWGKENDRPINLGEFGTFSGIKDMDSRIRWTKFVADTGIEKGFSICYWQFVSNFAVYDDEKKEWIKPLLDAIIPPKQ